MKKLLAALVLLCVAAISAFFFLSGKAIHDPAFLEKLDAPGSVADRLGRPVKWIEVEFRDGFFDDFDRLNASNELEVPWQEEFLSDNDTVAVALRGWGAVDELPGIEDFLVSRSEIRGLPDDDFFYVQRLSHFEPNGTFRKYFNMIFFNMNMIILLDAECQPLFVYEVVRLVALPQDKAKMVGNPRVKSCMEN